MVNRTIQQKILKQKRRGKHKLRSKAMVNKGTSYLNTAKSSGLDRAEMGLYKARTGNTIFRDRNGSIQTKKTQSPEEVMFWEKLYPTHRYTQKEIKERGLPDEYGIRLNNPVPRGEALRRADQLLKETDVTMHFELKKTPDYTLVVFFNAKKDKWYLFETDLSKRRIRKSGVYGHKVLAVEAARRDEVCWIDTIWIGPEE